MLRNNLKIAVRNLLRSKGNSALNILGLSVGIAICILIMLYSQHELRYDQSHRYAHRTYRIAYAPNEETSFKGIAKTPIPLAAALIRDFPEISETVRYFKVGSGSATGPTVRYHDVKFTENRVYLADPNAFDVFDIELILGDSESAFQKPQSVILSEETAIRYFGEKDPIGEILTLQSYYELEVTGVFKQIDDHSHFAFDFLAPFDLLRVMWPNWEGFDDSWETPFTWTYVVLQNNVELGQLQEKLPPFITRHYPKELRDRTGNFRFALQPITGIHFDSHMSREMEPNSSRSTLYALVAIAALVLIIACINFMNMATAKSVKRAREVGLRKVLGASRPSLIRQFLGEATLFSTLATLLGLLMAALLLPLFNHLAGVTLSSSNTDIGQVLMFLGLISLVVGFLAGSYPSFFLSSFRPLETLKGAMAGTGSAAVRKALVIFQFTITIVFIISILIMSNQMKFIRDQELGYNEDQLLVISRPDGDLSMDVIKESLMALPGVLGVVNSAGSLPGQTTQSWTFLPSSNVEENRKSLLTIWAGSNFIELFGLELLDGRGFNNITNSDSLEYMVINESAVKEFGWDDEVVGSYLGEAVWRSNKVNEGQVVGVVKDFHFQTLHEPVKPIVILFNKDFGNVLVKVDKHNPAQTISSLQEKWNDIAPNASFDYQFLDQRVAQLYERDQNMNNVIATFTIVAMLISCFGLYGLASYTAEQRTKEIGIRKVLGASINTILLMLSKGFALLLVIALIIAIPLGFYFMDLWLQNFSYRISISILTFVLAGASASAIALVTISIQTAKAAIGNPVDALRCE